MEWNKGIELHEIIMLNKIVYITKSLTFSKNLIIIIWDMKESVVSQRIHLTLIVVNVRSVSYMFLIDS